MLMIFSHMAMGLNVKRALAFDDNRLLDPRRLSHSGIFPSDKASAVRFASDGIYLGDILHSRLYLQLSHSARCFVPVTLEDLPFNNQWNAFSLSVCTLTCLPSTKSPKQNRAITHASSSCLAIISLSAPARSDHGIEKNFSPQQPPTPYVVDASTKMFECAWGILLRMKSIEIPLFLFNIHSHIFKL